MKLNTGYRLRFVDFIKQISIIFSWYTSGLLRLVKRYESYHLANNGYSKDKKIHNIEHKIELLRADIIGSIIRDETL